MNDASAVENALDIAKWGFPFKNLAQRQIQLQQPRILRVSNVEFALTSVQWTFLQ